MSRMLIMAGGTGGHVIPALAVAEELIARGVEVHWVGTVHGLESRLAPAAGIKLDTIAIKGLRKSGWGRVLAMPWILTKALVQTTGLMRRRKPDAVLGMGGFVAGPGGLVAAFMGLPLILHEQNSVAGLTNRWLARMTRHVLTGFPVARGLGGGTWVGNPVAQAICQLPPPQLRLAGRTGAFRILVLGGSQGASVFNQQLPALLGTEKLTALEVLHQCGQQDAHSVRAAYAEHGITATVEPFIDDMAAAYRWCDFAICRAGAMTIAELCAAGVAALLVPYPHAVNDHQALNAEFMVDAGAAWMVRQADFINGDWLEPVAALATAREQLMTMAQAARRLARPNAAIEVADTCWEVLCARP